MWRLPDTVGGGVSTENTFSGSRRPAASSNAWHRSASQSACAAASTAFAS
jgi:hypothetical protein